MQRLETQERVTSADSIPSDTDLIVRFIRNRQRLVESTGPMTQTTKRVPELTPLSSLNTLFGSPELWTTVDGVRYIPDRVVKSMILRKDGQAIDKKRFSVFIDMRRNKIEKTWGIRALTTRPKQRFQYWDEPFVRAFFSSIQNNYNDQGKYGQNNVDKLVYTINESVSLKELMKVKRIAEAMLFHATKARPQTF